MTVLTCTDNSSKLHYSQKKSQSVLPYLGKPHLLKKDTFNFPVNANENDWMIKTKNTSVTLAVPK